MVVSLRDMKPIIGISIGDLNGVGPEIIVKAFTDHRLHELATYVVFGSTKVLNEVRKKATDREVQFHKIQDFTSLNTKQLNVLEVWTEDVPLALGSETKEGGAYAIRSLMAASKALAEGHIHAMVTMPINKNNTYSDQFPYTGHTPFLKEYFKAREVAMLMIAEDLRVALLTEHIPLSEVSKSITQENIHKKLDVLITSLQRDFGIDVPKIAVLGLNPHAGDGGVIGKEEKEVIAPAIQEYKSKKAYIFGPYPADGFFARRSDTKFDAVLAMYHDQGLIPFKSFDLHTGVNYTAGMDVIRTSPDHGTAYDIAGKGVADTSSFISSLFLCLDVYHARKGYAEAFMNPLKRGIGLQAMKKNKSKEDKEE